MKKDINDFFMVFYIFIKNQIHFWISKMHKYYLKRILIKHCFFVEKIIFKKTSFCFVYLEKMRAILTIEIGQAGIQLGNAIWEQYCAEHGIDNTGKKEGVQPKNDSFKAFFEETSICQFVPRNLAHNAEIFVVVGQLILFDLQAELGVDLIHYSNTLVAFPLLHFLTTGMSAIVPKTHVASISYTLRDIVDECLKPSNWLVQYTNSQRKKILVQD
ncbi:Alpha-tubulin [Reticulomyxa filosa]|uniref:Alpha-tubulin n=1 Tax=Reticulomyxa filosa TaxID=46433 RepID=X6PBI8_RETFI|nr:Alpha-tubulin [Reticulomyxa filosa]|eukprot:ETO35478.1 Alpha-tubulin [Reticulomyxa filosa]